MSSGSNNSGVYRSTNDGDSWTNIGLATYAVTSLTINGNDILATVIDVGPNTGVFRTTTGGGSWDQINSGLPVDECMGLAIDSFGYAYVGTLGAGVYKSSDALTSTPAYPNPIPLAPFLGQNYPNPFNPRTTIKFAITSAEQVTLTVYDLLGRQIATLLSEHLAPGVHSVVWDAKDVSSGVYFYRLSAGSFHDVKKLLLLK